MWHSVAYCYNKNSINACIVNHIHNHIQLIETIDAKNEEKKTQKTKTTKKNY